MIWSSLPNVTEMTHGEVTNVHHYDSKAEVERYVRSLSFPISVFYLAGWYMQNVWHQMVPAPQAEPDGTVVFPLAWPPDMQLPWIDITDTGKYLSPALRDPEKYNGRSLTAATAYYSAQDIVDTWTKVVGKSVRLLKEEEISRFITDPIQEMVVRPGLLLTKYRYFGPTGPGDLEWTHAQLQPKDKLTSWEQFLTRHGPWFEDI
ncbi:NmrA-like family-domain-containing protein [Aspergillus cavernicola]|uniref:NmrA-like family-domain-containing protein n=1 Tax=Aspergillus cavernicola TaxID=176166 RepID=A0ABR4I3D1_9EURO